MRLQLATWIEVEAYLKRSTGIIIPIGSTEQHGPNGLIGTDAICPEAIAVAVGETVDALVGPTLAVGMAQHHLGFPGSITLRPGTLMAMIVDIVGSLAHHGFDRIFFLNGHGGNIASLSAAMSEVYAQRSLAVDSNGSQVRCRVTNWYEGARVKALSKQLFGDSEGSHATPSEVSLTYYLHRDAIKSVAMTPQRAPKGPIFDCQDYRARFPDGRIGSDPSLANPEAGERLYRGAIEDVATDYKSFISQR